MNTIEHIRQLFEYNDWANRRILVALKQISDERSRMILAHLLTTEREYYERLFGKDSFGFDFWPDLSLEECGNMARETAMLYEKLIRRFEEEGLDVRVHYRTSKGIPRENTIREILSHVLFHSSIHRGNIISRIRDLGGEPPETDYIIYLRETVYI